MRPSLSRILLGGLLLSVLVVAQETGKDEALLTENKLPGDAPGLLKFFKERTATLADEARIKKLVEKLGADDFEEREDASRQLISLGSRALKWLQEAAKSTDPEVSRRADDCQRQIKQGSTALVLGAAIRQLGRTRDPEAAAVLLTYAPTAEQENVGDEVRDVLTKLALRDGKAEPALVAGLTDADAIRRASSGVALARGRVTDQLPAVRKLLEDRSPQVRWHVGMALVTIREKPALPALISLLDDAEITPRQMSLLEDMLYRVGEERAPQVVSEAGGEARKRFRLAWETWWKDHGEKLDAARLEETTKTLGHTLVVLLDQNTVIDLDANNKPRFTITEIQFPLDAQYLPGDHVLLAEHGGQKVTERDKTGKIVWEKEVDSPLSAQRLPNGNTLIATRTSLLEVDPKGKEVSTYTPPRGELIMRMQRLRDGRTALVTQLGVTRFSLLDATMKEVRGFGVDVRTSGGRIEVLPNGNILIPENGNNRVVEHDMNGRIIWETPIEQPIAAWRLPNGNTMITSMNVTIGAIEVDRTGKPVWNYKADTRVTRALRR